MSTRRNFLKAVPLAAAAIAAPQFLWPAAAGAVVGSHQSPIDIDTSAVHILRGSPLRLEYAHSDLEVSYVSRGDCGARGEEETIEAAVTEGSGSAFIGGTEYVLEQFHFHKASEHTVNGKHFPLEQHFVHRSEAGELLVVALLLRASRSSGPLDRVLEELPEECATGFEVPDVDLRELLPRTLSVYRYTGSLTTSPFTEPVDWNVLATPGKVSRSVLDRLDTLFPSNKSRAVQPLNGRVVNFVPARGHRADRSTD